MGDSISEGVVETWVKKDGDFVELDEVVAVIETDKVKVDIRAPEAGQITKVFAFEGNTVEVGKDFFELDTEKVGQSESKAAAPASSTPPPDQPAQTQPKQEAPKAAPSTTPEQAKPAQKPQETPKSPAQSPQILTASHERKETRVPMSRLRQRVAQRLKDSQNTYAFLTTFNEIDMSEVMLARKSLGEEFQKANGVKLGFMSFFIKAVTTAMKERPIVNAVIENNEVVYRNYVDVSVAVQGPDGLVVPVVRNADKMSFADIEKNIVDLGVKAKNGKLAIEDMTGGTITVSNGGIFGSIMSTPLINPPQSAILGMHNVVQRPVVRNGQIVARPVMYVALSYDHRLLDGREGASFLKRVCTLVDEPKRLLLTL